MGRAPLVMAAAAFLAACGLEIVGALDGATEPGTPRSPGETADGDASGAGGAVDVDAGPAGASLDATVDVGPDAPAIGAGQALRFDGDDDHVSVGSLPIPADFTIEAWLRPAAFGGDTYPFAKDRQGQSAAQLRLGLDSTGRVYFVMSDAAGNDRGLYDGGYELISPAPLAANVWTHVAVTKSGAAFSLYVGGVSVSTFTATAVFAYGGPDVVFRIGARVASNGTGVDGAYDGAIDELRLWSVARSGAEIAAAMSGPVAPSSPGLVRYFRFDEGSGTSTADAKGGLTGTFAGAPQWVPSTAF